MVRYIFSMFLSPVVHTRVLLSEDLLRTTMIRYILNMYLGIDVINTTSSEEVVL